MWGCKAEARIYNPQEQKLDPKTVSAFFIGYLEKSKGFRFYCPNHRTRILETNKARFVDEMYDFDNIVVDNLDEVYVDTTAGNLDSWFVYSSALPEIDVADNIIENNGVGDQYVEAPLGHIEPQHVENGILVENPEPPQPIEPLHVPDVVQNPVVNPPIAVPEVRRSQRIKRSAISDIYETVFITETDIDLGEVDDPLSYSQAIESAQAENWYEAMLA